MRSCNFCFFFLTVSIDMNINLSSKMLFPWIIDIIWITIITKTWLQNVIITQQSIQYSERNWKDLNIFLFIEFSFSLIVCLLHISQYGFRLNSLTRNYFNNRIAVHYTCVYHYYYYSSRIDLNFEMIWIHYS